MLLLLLACQPVSPKIETPPPEWGYDSLPPQTCILPDRPVSTASISVQPAFPSLTFKWPVALFQAPGDGGHWYVVEKLGRVLRFVNDPGSSTYEVIADLSDHVLATSSELGLLGATFDPAGTFLYLSYTTGDATHIVSRISRVPINNGVADVAKEKTILEIAQPFANHNGGNILFGPDGYLYAGYGDGGSAGDPYQNGQNPEVLLGKMLRIDVQHGDPYAIPADNPFATGGGAPEIYALGMRNPWRWSFDRATGELWVGDVGQNLWEEVDLVERGGNYGWDTREGAHCYPKDPCETAGLTDPIAEYSHNGGNASIVGGYVYRGSKVPSLIGTYLFTDSYSGTVWGLKGDPVTGDWVVETLVEGTGLFADSFGESLDGEVFLVDLGGGIYEFAATPETGNSDFPSLLSETGCVDPEHPTDPAESMFPYAVNMPLWSDGAKKERWLGLPDGSVLTPEANGHLPLPIGTVAMKNFEVDGILAETRLLVHHDDNTWAGYSYAWREDGSDADLLPSSQSLQVGEQSWTWPSRAQCVVCHTEASGRSLGLETGQLDLEYLYQNGATVNQLEQLQHLGILASAQNPVSPLPGLQSGESPEAIARAYLHANCSMCHQPGSVGGGAMDLRWTTPLEQTGLCNGEPERGDLGVVGAKLLTPGDPEHSLISLRMRATDANRMPPLGTMLVDEEGAAAVDAWINGAICP